MPQQPNAVPVAPVGEAKPVSDRAAFDEVIDIASRLTSLMTRENECLGQFDFKGMEALQEEKLQLTRIYCHRVYELKKDPARLAALTQVVRDEMKKVMLQFDEVAKQNEKALRSTREANDRVLKSVVEAANTLSPRVAGYSRTGVMSKGYGNGRMPAPPPISINSCY